MHNQIRAFVCISVARTLALVLALGLASSAADAQSRDEVTIRRVEIGSGVAMLVGRGGNIGVSTGSDGVFLIDDQYAPLTPKILAAVEDLDPRPVRFVLNTHWHGDHTGGNENLAEAGALIFAHDNVRERMQSDQFIAALGRSVPASPPAALPVVTFDRELTLHLNGQAVRATHVDPAHTDGDALVHLSPANVIHTGDLYFAGMYPFFDLSSGGRFDGLIAAADRVLAIADAETKIIPGHGPLSNANELEAWRAMLVDVRRRVQAAIDDGVTLDEIVASGPTRVWDAQYGGGFVKPDSFVRMVHASLTASP